MKLSGALSRLVKELRSEMAAGKYRRIHMAVALGPGGEIHLNYRCVSGGRGRLLLAALTVTAGDVRITTLDALADRGTDVGDTILKAVSEANG